MSAQITRPKFVLSLGIHELTNIPSPVGECYVKWHMKERSISSFKGKTKLAHIRDYKVVWGHSTQALMKIGLTKNHQLKDKTLVLCVYQLPPHQHHHHHHHNGKDEAIRSRSPTIISDINQLSQDISNHQNEKSKKTYLGKVEINLSEFVNFEESKTNRYLLKEAKINAVLHVEIRMEAVEGQNIDYNAPQLKSKGLSSVFNSETSSFPDSGTSPISSHHGSNLKSGSASSSNNRLHKSLAISNDPVISKLYENTFDISWDYRPGEYNIVECIDDIFSGGDGWAKNEDGVRLIDLQRGRVKDEIEKTKDIFATKFSGVNEFDIRGEMKSWQITHSSMKKH